MHAFLLSADIFLNSYFKLSNSLDPDQAICFILTELGPPKLFAKFTSS